MLEHVEHRERTAAPDEPGRPSFVVRTYLDRVAVHPAHAPCPHLLPRPASRVRVTRPCPAAPADPRAARDFSAQLRYVSHPGEGRQHCYIRTYTRNPAGSQRRCRPLRERVRPPVGALRHYPPLEHWSSTTHSPRSNRPARPTSAP